MKRLSVFMAMVLVVLMTSASGSVALSSGCEVFNSAGADGDYVQRNTEVTLEAGEIITFDATSTGSGDDPVGVALFVGSAGTPPQELALVDSAGFPGSVSYTVPSDGRYAVLWTTQSQGSGPFAATWDVSCERPDGDPEMEGWNAGQCVRAGVTDRAADPSAGVGPGVVVGGELRGPQGSGNSPFDEVIVCERSG